tara:strand:- start:81 stop:272 length:192 start_codon:yes stop_codon:yes gene_type:complete
MYKELEDFDMFVDDIISSDVNLLKSELDFLIMQYIFDSLELDQFKKYRESINTADLVDSYLVA